MITKKEYSPEDDFSVHDLMIAMVTFVIIFLAVFYDLPNTEWICARVN